MTRDLMSDAVIELLRQLLPPERQDQVAVSVVFRARMP